MRTDLTARYDATRGTPRPHLMFSDEFNNETRLDRVILIHGIRNNEAAALRAYRRFRNQSAKVEETLPARMYTMTWPGDAITALLPWYFYNNEGNADECGHILSDFLIKEIERNSTRRYTLIAHSLGCRLTVRALTRVFRLYPKVGRRYRVVLMAAAMPIEMLAPGSDEREALQQICTAVSLSSKADWILQWVFPLGRIVSGGYRAVGIESEPRGTHWADLPIFTEGFKHSDYWNDADGEIGRLLASMIGLAVSAPLSDSKILGHQLPYGRLAEAEPLANNLL